LRAWLARGARTSAEEVGHRHAEERRTTDAEEISALHGQLPSLRSVIQEELSRVQQTPHYVFVTLLRCRTVLDVLHAHPAFLVGRQAAQNPEEQLLDAFLVVFDGLENRGHAALWVADLLENRGVVGEVERLHDGRLRVAFAIALHVGVPQRSAEDLERILQSPPRPLAAGPARHLDRLRPCREE